MRKCEKGEETRIVANINESACVISQHGADHVHRVGIGKRVPDGQTMVPGEDYYFCDGKNAVLQKVALPAGPAQVATKKYRDGWDRTFGSN